MKRILIILACFASIVSLSAQDTQSSTSTPTANDFHTLFHKGDGSRRIPLGYFIELDGGYTHFGRKSVFLPGMSAGIILNHHWTIGMTGNIISNSPGTNHHHSGNDSINTRRDRSYSQGGYGGLLLEYTLLPKSKVHLSFPLTIGSGYMGHSHEITLNDSVSSKKEWIHHGKYFFVVEPGIKLEFNVVKNLRIGVGISYRYSPENNHTITSPDLLNQLTGKISFRLGRF